MTVGPVRAGDRLTLERDGNGWRLSGTRQPAALCDARRADRADRRWTGRRDGGRAGWHRRRATSRHGQQHGQRAARHADVSPALRVAGDAVAPAAAGVIAAALYRRGALARAMMMSGAMERAMDTRGDLCQERKQFGRPISQVPGGAAEPCGDGRPDGRGGRGGRSRHRGAVDATIRRSRSS